MAKLESPYLLHDRDVLGHDDNIQIRAMPSGISVRGRYWRQGPFLHGVVHVQVAGTSPETIYASVDLRPILRRVKQRMALARRVSGDVIGFFNFKKIFKAVASIGKSALFKGIVNAVKSVAKSKIVGAIVGAAAIVFPPVGIPAAAVYAAANVAVNTLEKAEAIKNAAQKVLATGTEIQRQILGAKAPAIANELKKAAFVKKQFRGIAAEAAKGRPQAKAFAAAVGIVKAHHDRVAVAAKKVNKPNPRGGLLVTTQGKIVPGKWLLEAEAARI